MKKELQEGLFKNYPHFFMDLPIYPYGDSTKEVLESLESLLRQEDPVVPIQFGIECGDGWYMILNDLLHNIDDHLHWDNVRRMGEVKNNFLRSILKNLKRRTYRLPHWLSRRTNRVISLIEGSLKKGRPPIPFRIDQIKEKYGGLRFYYSGGTEAISGMVYLAESLSYSICETCGTTKNVGSTSGWIYTICKTCWNKNEGAKNLEWHKNSI